jgi:hypothetical protein
MRYDISQNIYNDTFLLVNGEKDRISSSELILRELNRRRHEPILRYQNEFSNNVCLIIFFSSKMQLTSFSFLVTLQNQV